ncbi:flagellin [Arthrobacter sp. KBS0702]|uniref:flagellin N-terminal helical domain-containing protein n=1 Tax=Arthrobacter sp. KBS0702 TaxID=2578107 RepID=UPI00110ED53D|nr:flagellin [Arthrobacter sp. KBS0702]QDW28877.1 flagellin [Arthrobacter sp. KBS0702]
MGFVINNNLAANTSYRNLNATQGDLSKSLEKLSTGLRINRAGDDAAGLSISEGLKAQITGSAQAARNAQDGISVIQTTEGALTEVHSILQRVRDLAVQAGNDSNNTDSRKAITAEATSLVDELDRMSSSTNFNGIKLLDKSAGTAGVMSMQVGAGSGDQIKVDLSGADIKTLATNLKTSIITTDGFASSTVAATTITSLDTAIGTVSSARAGLGATQNRLEHTVKALNIAGENLQAAQSRIADVDMASEMVKFTKANILSQAGTAMLAQANQSSQGVLSLLR